MHELSIATAIVDTALRHAGGRPVTRVSMRVGTLRQVVPDSLQFYFEIVARDTRCAGAELELTEVGTRVRCGECTLEWEPAIPAFRCPRCESAQAEIVSGEELQVDYIEIEEQEPACIGPR